MNVYILNATLNGKLLTELLCEKIAIKGLITLNENGINKTPEFHDYTGFCEEKDIECVKLSSYNFSKEEDKERLKKLDIDLIIIASWQRLIPSWLINQCKIGIIGAHGSHEGITRGRGRSPQNWAILTGQKSFSISIFWVEEGTDNGPIIDSRNYELAITDNILVSYVKINLLKVEMILSNIENGRIQKKEGIPQDEEGLYLPQRKKEDGMIDWNRDATEIYNFIRALTKPYPGAYTVYEGDEIVIWSALPVVTEAAELYDSFQNGTVISILEDSALIKCGKNLLLVQSCTNFEKIKQGMVFESANYKEQMQKIIDRHREKYNSPLSSLILQEVED